MADVGAVRDFQAMDPDAIFAEFIRRRAGQGRQGFSATGPGHRYSLQIPFIDAARGGSARTTLPFGGSLDLAIPEGLRRGQSPRLRGKGGEGFGNGPRGDAIVTVSVAPHPHFRRASHDILLTGPVTLDEAVLGAKIEVPTFGGKVFLTVPPDPVADTGETCGHDRSAGRSELSLRLCQRRLLGFC